MFSANKLILIAASLLFSFTESSNTGWLQARTLCVNVVLRLPRSDTVTTCISVYTFQPGYLISILFLAATMYNLPNSTYLQGNYIVQLHCNTYLPAREPSPKDTGAIYTSTTVKSVSDHTYLQ